MTKEEIQYIFRVINIFIIRRCGDVESTCASQPSGSMFDSLNFIFLMNISSACCDRVVRLISLYNCSSSVRAGARMLPALTLSLAGSQCAGTTCKNRTVSVRVRFCSNFSQIPEPKRPNNSRLLLQLDILLC